VEPRTDPLTGFRHLLHCELWLLAGAPSSALTRHRTRNSRALGHLVTHELFARLAEVLDELGVIRRGTEGRRIRNVKQGHRARATFPWAYLGERRGEAHVAADAGPGEPAVSTRYLGARPATPAAPDKERGRR
jgi:hypothetical protein